MKFKQIEHIGIVVKDLDTSLKSWEERLGLSMSPDRIYLRDTPGINRRAYVPITDDPNGSYIVLYQPLKGQMKRDLDEFGEGFHHLCLEVDDLTEGLAEARQRGCECPLLDYSRPEPPYMGAVRKPGLLFEFANVGNEPELNNVRVQLEQRRFVEAPESEAVAKAKFGVRQELGELAGTSEK